MKNNVTIMMMGQILVTAEPNQKDYQFVHVVKHWTEEFQKTQQLKD